METTEKTFTNVADQMQEAFQSTADLYKKASLSILEAYNKQLAISAGWYNDIVGSTLKTDSSKNYGVTLDLLRKNMENYRRTWAETNKLAKEVTGKIVRSWREEKSFLPLSKEVSDTILSIFRKQASLFSESGAQFLNANVTEESLKASAGQFKNLISGAIKTSEQTIENLMETYNKKAEFTQKASEQLLNSITKQFDAVAEMNARFFHDGPLFSKEKATDGKTDKTNKP